MSLWEIIGGVLEIIDWICRWRFSVCLIAGVALAFAVAGSIAAEPLRWIVAGVIVITSIIIGWRWERSH